MAVVVNSPTVNAADIASAGVAEAALEIQDQDSAHSVTPDIVRLSGFAGLSYQIRQLALSHLQSSSARTKQTVMSKLLIWAPEPLTHKLERGVEEFNTEQKSALLALLMSDAMIKGRESESQALALQTSSEYSDYVQRLRQQPPSGVRLATIDALDQAMGMSRWMLLARGVVANELAKYSIPFDVSESFVRQSTHEFLLFAYRFTANDDIYQQAALWQTPPLSAWSEAAYQSLISQSTMLQSTMPQTAMPQTAMP